MPHPSRRFLLLATPLLLTGCGTVLDREKYQPRSDWPLAPPKPRSTEAGARLGPRAGVVLVRSVLAGPGLADRGLLTLEPDGSLHRGYYNRWAVPPAQAVTAALITWLQASGRFAAVIGEGSSLSPTILVEATLETLLADPSSHQARAAMTLVVAKPHGLGEIPLVQKRLRATAPLSGVTAPDLVRAQREALAQLLSQAVVLITSVAPGKA
ncbi:cholesterol transport system auxiliary component [Acidiphilium sp. MT5]